jgi:hypothetical protein
MSYLSDVTQSNKNLRSLSESWCAKLCEGATSFVTISSAHGYRNCSDKSEPAL